MSKLFNALLSVVLLLAVPVFGKEKEPAYTENAKSVQQYDLYEITIKGPSEGNPFTEVRLSAVFNNGDKIIEVPGFYDGEGVYKVRFMPEQTGFWRWETKSNRWPLTGQRGGFTAVAATGDNHGPVRVHNTFHFAYADGTPYRELGTTCYSWHHRSEESEKQTLQTLAASPFNKVRMCIFPQDHGSKPEQVPPPRFPYAGTPPKSWDFSRFNPAFFQHLEQRVAELRALGIEADLILFHPYGKFWNFDTMSAEQDDLYVRYVVARLSAFRNVWWSMANEYDFLRTKTTEDWDRLFQVVQKADPYAHLRSIHNGFLLYDYSKPWVTHASIQNGAAVEDPLRAVLYRDVWRKPVVYDEVKYEGNSDRRWGNLSGEEMVHRFWCGVVAGTYVGHGECFTSKDDKNETVWLGQGGVLKGQSPARLAFMRKILADSPEAGIEPIDKWQQPYTGGKAGDYYLIYLGKDTPRSWHFQLYKDAMRDGIEYHVDVIDTWNMTITPIETNFVTKKVGSYFYEDAQGREVPLPGKPYQLLRIRRVGGAAALGVGDVPVE